MTEVKPELRQFTPHGIKDILGIDGGKDIVCKEGTFYDEKGREKKKRVRTTFSGRQIFELERMFERKKYLNAEERIVLCRLIELQSKFMKQSYFQTLTNYRQASDDLVSKSKNEMEKAERQSERMLR